MLWLGAYCWGNTEVVAQRCCLKSCSEHFCKIHRKTSKMGGQAWNFIIKKEMLSSGFCEPFRIALLYSFTKHQRMTSSEKSLHGDIIPCKQFCSIILLLCIKIQALRCQKNRRQILILTIAYLRELINFCSPWIKNLWFSDEFSGVEVD